jgi:hypothetical protein
MGARGPRGVSMPRHSGYLLIKKKKRIKILVESDQNEFSGF